MSYTTVYRMPESGELIEVKEFQNAYGSAMRIWNSLVKSHLVDPTKDIDQEMGRIMYREEAKSLWKLVDDPKLTYVERMTLAWTFDKAVCEHARLAEMADLFLEFDRVYPAGGHLPALADLYRSECANPSLGLCVVQTSVACDVWRTECDADGEQYMYDASKDTGHYFIFEEYKEINHEPC